MPLNVSQHPLVADKLAILRDRRTEPKKFRELVRELTWLLGYEATADLATRPFPIETPLGPMIAACLEPRVGLIPILRAGLGMVDGMLELLPTAEVWHLGLYRDERTLQPVEYYNKLPDAATVQVCLVLDTMLATGRRAASLSDPGSPERYDARRLSCWNPMVWTCGCPASCSLSDSDRTKSQSAEKNEVV